MVALLGSRLEPVRRRAVAELVELGSGVAGVLRAASRSRTPARRGALAALAEMGWHELDPPDRELLTRFVRTRQVGETPAPLGPWFEGTAEWYAVPTTDQAAVLDAFDLCDPVPATMRMGLAPWREQDGWHPGDRTTYSEWLPTFDQVYVSPAVEGWTLVFANHPTLDGIPDVPKGGRADDAMSRCRRLSERFGAAHWYAYSYRDDQSGWCVYEAGSPARYCFFYPVYFDLPEGEVLVGPTDLAELGAPPTDGLRAWLEEHDTSADRPHLPAPPPCAEADDDDEGLPFGWEFSASRVAWRLSVSPESFGPESRVEGTSVLAVPQALRDRPRYGALPV
jgi:hypothetical protein